MRTPNQMPTPLRVAMTIAAASLFVSSALAAPKPIPASFKCPAADIRETKCSGPSDCLYPHPADKTAYIHCSVNPDGVTGTPHLKACPDKLVWNDNIKRCDYDN